MVQDPGQTTSAEGVTARGRHRVEVTLPTQDALQVRHVGFETACSADVLCGENQKMCKGNVRSRWAADLPLTKFVLVRNLSNTSSKFLAWWQFSLRRGFFFLNGCRVDFVLLGSSSCPKICNNLQLQSSALHVSVVSKFIPFKIKSLFSSYSEQV